MSESTELVRGRISDGVRAWIEMGLLVLLFFAYAGDPAPMVNEAHYLVKAKNFWQPEYCANDVFASSGKAHWMFYVVFGWPTKFVSLEATAWMGRFAGWMLVAFGLRRLCAASLGVGWVSIPVALLWIAGVEYANLAGEWVIGGIEAKVPAFGFALAGMAEIARGRWNRVWLWLGAASAFHVLVGGWSVIAGVVAWLGTERGRDQCQPLLCRELFIGGAIALFGLVPSLALTIGTDDADAAVAAKIYAYFRLSHHLLPAALDVTWYARHFSLLLATIVAYSFLRRVVSEPLRRLWWFTIGTVLILVTGLFVGLLPAIAPDLAAKLLRFYWFRLSDAFIPLMSAMLLVSVIVRSPMPFMARVAASGVLVIATVAVFWSSYRRSAIGIPPSASHELLGWNTTATPAEQRQSFEDWVAVCQWIEMSTAADEVFLTPRHQQTFKWYASRAEVVNWKDVPQDVESLIEWRYRYSAVFPPRLGRRRTSIRYDVLRELADKYDVRWMVVDRRVVGRNLPLVRVYPTNENDNPTYAVYALPASRNP